MRAMWLAVVAALLAPTLACAQDPSIGETRYGQLCAACHGGNLAGGEGPALMGRGLTHGDSAALMTRVVREGLPPKMPAFNNQLSHDEIEAVVSFVRRKRRVEGSGGTKVPTGVVHTDLHDFQVEALARLPSAFAFAFLPDGRILLTEGIGRLRIMERGKLLPEPVIGAPTGKSGLAASSQNQAVQDVVLHPNYRQNGWIYVGTTEPAPGGLQGAYETLIIKVHRGRIEKGRWVDETVIAEIPNNYGGAKRMAFDAQGHLYVSVPYSAVGYDGPLTAAASQDLTVPGGKILRMNDDGSVPADNPFADKQGITRYIWTFGHRVALGLAFSPAGELWETENGPRGGDEINRLSPGKNYGWAVVTWGHRYDDKPVGANPDGRGYEQPVVAYVPAPSLSAITFYTGDAFPRWKGAMLMATLKQRNLYRIRFEDGRLASQEVILRDMDRIRDVGQGPDGLIYVLTDSGAFARLVPAEAKRAPVAAR